MPPFSVEDGARALVQLMDAHARGADFNATLTKPVVQAELYQGIVRALGLEKDAADRNGQIRIRTDLDLSAARALLVEDNLVNQRVALGILAKAGIRPDVADNGALAVEAFKAHPYDLVLMDCQMPVMDGMEATRLIREHEAKQGRTPTPILALTAYATPQELEPCYTAGMNGYLTKPFKAEELFALIRRWLSPECSDSEQAPAAHPPLTEASHGSMEAEAPEGPGGGPSPLEPDP